MCREMAYELRAYNCPPLPPTPKLLRGGWREVVYIWWSQSGAPFSDYLHLLGMSDVRKGDGVPWFTWTGEEENWVYTRCPHTSVRCPWDSCGDGAYCVQRPSSMVLHWLGREVWESMESWTWLHGLVCQSLSPSDYPTWWWISSHTSEPGASYRRGACREIPDTLTIIRDVVQISDNVMAMGAEMTIEELVQEMIRIGGTARPTLMYWIAR